VHHAVRHPEEHTVFGPTWSEPSPGSQHPDDTVAFLSWLLALSKALDEAMAVARTTLEAGIAERNNMRDWVK
jgi:hypothetical protein